MDSLENRRLLSGQTPGVILNDDFAGNSLNQTNWYVPAYDPSGSTYIPNTQFQVAPYLPPVSGGAAHLPLNTFNPSARTPGDSFFGTEIVSQQLFSVGDGLKIDVEIREAPQTPGGIVSGFFLYTPPPAPGGPHSEIDFELLTNNPTQVQTNEYNNVPLGTGTPATATLPNGDQSQYHTYEILWLPNEIQWSVDGQVIRTDTADVPTTPMSLYFNTYAPSSSFWPAASNPALQPAMQANNNQFYNFDLDSVTATQLGPTSAWSGNGDGHSFADPNNWVGNAAPAQTNNVIVPTGANIQTSSGPATTITLGGLFVYSGGTFDLERNSLAINFSGSDPVSTLQGYLHSAYNNGSWLGSSGLTSTTVAAQVAANKGTTNGLYSLGYADGNLDGSIGGAAPNQIIISPQLVADATEDGKVDFNDLLALAQNTGSTTADWVHADFNFDGIVDFNDLLLLAQNINKTNGNTPLAAELAAALPAQVAVDPPVSAKVAVAVNPLFSTVPISDSSSSTDSLTDSLTDSTAAGAILEGRSPLLSESQTDVLS